MSWKQNNGRDRGHIDGIGYFLKGPNDSIIKAIEPSGNYVSTITNDAGVTKVFLNIAYPTEANQTLSSDLNGNLKWIDLSGGDSFVPYTGADKPVNLGNYDLTVQNMTFGLGGGTITTNTAIGSQALYKNTTGNENTANGYEALFTNTTGNENTAIGYQALYRNEIGSDNTAIGSHALYSNGIGSDNTAIGSQALNRNTTGVYNTAIGSQALYSNTGGSDNTAIGFQALYDNSGGQLNTAIGNYAGKTSINKTNCTFIGYEADDPSGNNNTIILGNSSIEHLKCQITTIASLSDERDKKNIETLSYGLNYINEINPVHFLWNMRDGGKIDIPEIGFTAQNLKKGQEKLNINIPNLVDDNNPNRLEVAPGVLIPILVKSIQELSNQLKETNRKLEELTAKVNSIL